MERRASGTRFETAPLPAVGVAILAAACVLRPSNVRVTRAPRLEPETSVAAPTREPDVEVPLGAAKDLGAVVVQPRFVSLPIPGFPDATVALPFDTEGGPRPVIVVIHGLGGRPEPQCDAWRNITGAAAFVLCPRGDYDAARSAPDDERYTHPGGDPLLHHIDAALAALAARFEGSVDVERPVLAGFSLGASEVAGLALQQPDRFPRIAILEGGLDIWSDAAADDFTARGAVRVLFGCGSDWCTPPARAASERIERSGTGSHVVFVPVGHRSTPPLQEAIRAELPWFLYGDPRWSPDPT